MSGDIKSRALGREFVNERRGEKKVGGVGEGNQKDL